MRKHPFQTLSILLLGCVLLACGKKKQEEPLPLTTPVHISGVGKIIPRDEVRILSTESAGVVEAVLVKENDTVRTGDTLLLLTPDIRKGSVQVATARLDAQQSRVRESEARLGEAENTFLNKEKEWNRIERLYREGAETGQRRDDLATELEQDRANLQSAREERAAALALLRENKESLRIAQDELTQRYLLAPSAGIVLDLVKNPGEYVAEGDPLVEFAPEGPVIAQCEVDEMFAGEVYPGQQALLLSPQSGDTLATGKVIFTGNYLRKKSLFYERPGEAEDRRVREVRILPDHPVTLLLNSKVNCVLLTPSTNLR